MTALEVVTSFIDAINSKRLDKMLDLMTPDHVFVDSDGTGTSGREKMSEGRTGYFAPAPDYRIDVRETLVRGGRVAVWQVSVNPEPIQRILNRSQNS